MNAIPIFGTRVANATYQHRPSAYALVQNQVGEFAVARTPLACYLPGGGMEARETPEQTVAREGREECGLVLKPRGFVGRAMEICFSVEDNAYFEKDSFFIAADVVGRVAQSELDHELVWMASGEALEALSHGSHRWAVERCAEFLHRNSC